jgi:hypothetical protein
MNTQSKPSINERINLIASHMFKQYKEHQQASLNTEKIFNKILEDLEQITEKIKNCFVKRGIGSSQALFQIDSDRSVGIINILWHSISFTTRGNTKPQALFRNDNPPLFTGRIIALNGNFYDASLDIQDQEYPDILECEIASLYIPADTTSSAILKIRHLGDEEFYLDQTDASKEFLMRSIEIICGGGIYHEEIDATEE